MKSSSPKPAKRSGVKADAATARSGAPSAGPIRARRLSQTGERTFSIVGVGASAGGLEAFTELLTALPLDTGMAFVLVQHLEAKHESILTKLLSKATQMPVTEIRQGTRVEPNHVYVIPANADLSIANGVLRILKRKSSAGRHLPIDHFLRKLAETRGPKAIGVILSGTASDGTLGLKTIKSAGGITFAQEPKSAQFDGMPKSAILAGCVDFVLTPKRIARDFRRSHSAPAPDSQTPRRQVRWSRHWTMSGCECSSCSGLRREWTSRSTRNPRSDVASPAEWP